MNKFTSFSTIIVTIGLLSFFSCSGNRPTNKIDRHAVVSRNDIVYTQPELTAPL